MAPPTTTRRLLTTILLIMMLTTSLARANSCANETDREAVSFNPTIQIFTSSGSEPHLNDTTETRVLDALERIETHQDELTVALASLQSKQDECLVSAEPHPNDTAETRVLDALERMETRQDDLTAALASLQSKQDECFASSKPHLSDTTETRVLDALERMETRQDELTTTLTSLQNQQGELTAALASLQSQQNEMAVDLASLLPRDCSDVLAAGRSWSGVYLIQPRNASETFRVYCDMTTDGGGWTVFQRRQNGDVDFFLDWNDYKVGFGDIEDEFWIGNDVLHLLTNDRPMQLRIDLWSFDNETAYAEYSSFSVSDESDYYRLEVGGYQGTAGDSMTYHNGHAFTTRDEDHDAYSLNCGTSRHGAWWYWGCGYSSLNGRYYIDGDTSGEPDGIRWYHWKGFTVSMKKTEMKVRPL